MEITYFLGFQNNFQPTQLFQLEPWAGNKGMVSQEWYFWTVKYMFIKQSEGKSKRLQRVRKTGSGKKLNEGGTGSHKGQLNPQEKGRDF